MGSKVEVFVICAAASIRPGSAKAFRLSRVGDDGEARPFSIVVAANRAGEFSGYVNTCPHEGVWLNIGTGGFFSADGQFLQCGRHGAHFEIETGVCVAGPCKGESLEPIAVAVIGGEICLCGIKLVEESPWPDPFDDADETMEVVIHPD